jgi:poly(A)-specific ribonuclease
MDFNHMVKSGIAYVTKGNANALAEKFYAKQFAKLSEESNTKSPAETKNSRRRVELTRLEDKNFHARSMASLREWLDAAIPNPNNGEEGANFLLPPCNSFLRRALYESIPREYPNLILETLSSTQQIRILRLNPNEKKRRTDRLLREGWERLITEKVGIYRIFLALTKACSGQAPANQAEHVVLASSVDKAMKLFDDTPSSFTSQRKIPIVVHNGLQDLFFLMTHFDAPELPETWADCKSRLHNYFPVIYDTKCMALEYATRENPRGATHLQAVYEQTLTTNPQWNRVFVAHNNNSSEEGVPAPENPEQAHDAAYDAVCLNFVISWTSIER